MGGKKDDKKATTKSGSSKKQSSDAGATTPAKAAGSKSSSKAASSKTSAKGASATTSKAASSTAPSKDQSVTSPAKGKGKDDKASSKASSKSGGKGKSKKKNVLPSGLKKLPKKAYEAELERLQAELVEMQAWLKESGNRLVVVFEGRDAAGKGSAIKRMTQYLNPRHARIVALPAPSEVHKTQWYFQRYIEHLPAAGEIVIFDRSWYNRAGVERVMGFCTTEEYQQFLHQAPIFERLLVEDGIMLRKYWFSVSDEEQERRFRDRHNDPMRRWKLSPMDLESITRWEAYSRAKDEMFVHTDIPEAPWYTVESEDKKRSRINVISHLLSTIPWEKLDPPELEIPERPEESGGAGYERPPREEFRYVPDVASELLDD
jgi:polyphosphate kinase 2